jgi:hypothetical protein
MYRLSVRENTMHMPGSKNRGRSDALIDRNTGMEYFRQFRGKIANFVLNHVGTCPDAVAARAHPVKGSKRLRDATAAFRSDARDLLALSGSLGTASEDAAVAQLAIIIEEDFRSARAASLVAYAFRSRLVWSA